MLFFKKKTSTNPVLDEFEQEFKNYPEPLKDEIDRIISITGFFMASVENQMFNELKKCSKVLYLNSEIEDIIYCTLLTGMSYANLSEYTSIRLSSLAMEIIFTRNMPEMSPEKVEKLCPLTKDDIDHDLHVSFFQLMTRIYGKWNKEFTDDELSNYKQLYEAYEGFMTSYISGILKAMNNVSINQIHMRAKEERKKYNNSQLMMIKLHAMLSMKQVKI